ncbi:MAG TPA: BatA domain-containing protein [Gemmatimonadaceae bacterium]|jgi:hypothetical protein
MIWQSPWALLGIVGVALPILMHLLGRGHARILKFPTLRFIEASRLLPTKRSRIQDPLLLAVRCTIIALAALALAQPLLLTRGRRESLDRGLARAIIVDTSASVARVSLDSARSISTKLAADAQASVIVETNDPASALRGAAAWIVKQQRRGEIAIVSDFQRGQIDRSDLAVVPASMGIVLRQLIATTAADSSNARIAVNGRTVVASTRVTATGEDIAWHASIDSTSRLPVELFAAATDAAALSALTSAAATIAVPLPVDSTRAIAVLFAGAPEYAAIAKTVEPPRIGWQLALLDDVRSADLSIVAAGNARVAGVQRFALLTNASPTSLDAARLVTLARRATSVAPGANELEPSVVADAELRTWERVATDAASTQHRPLDENGPSDARWLWAIVLLLLVIEWRLRRASVVAAPAAEERARAA